jgi:hypothetical protein
MRCIHCPTPENLPCAGRDIRRFCELIDPSCPQYDAGYRNVIVGEVRRAEAERTTRLLPYQNPAFSKPIIERGETTVIALDCCGGGLPPGILDAT